MVATAHRLNLNLPPVTIYVECTYCRIVHIRNCDSLTDEERVIATLRERLDETACAACGNAAWMVTIGRNL